MQLKQILQTQKERAEQSSQEQLVAEDLSTYIHYINNGSRFLVPISQVKEICEKPEIRIYPNPTEGHLGISNIHGNIIPILSMKAFSENGAGEEESIESKDFRLIVMISDQGDPFGVLGTSIKKVTPTEKWTCTESSVLIDGQLMLPITALDILQRWQKI
jgi:chemotaxis signal transduction protein